MEFSFVTYRFLETRQNIQNRSWNWNFYRTRVRSLGMLVTNCLPNSLTDSVTFSKLDWCDPGMWRCQLKTCWGCYCWWCWCWEMWRSLWLLMLVMRIVLATVCCRFRSWGLDIKPNFCSILEHNIWSRFWSWLLMFGWGYKVESWSRFWA